MDIQKCTSFIDACSVSMEPLNCSTKVHEKVLVEKKETVADPDVVADVDIDIREIYFLIMHFLSAGPCQRTSGQFWNELLEHQLLPRRYHAWYSRSGALSGHENDNGDSFPLSYGKLVERYPHIEKDHLVKLLKRLIVDAGRTFDSIGGRSAPSAVDVPTLLGTGSFSLLASDRKEVKKQVKPLPAYLRWPHMQADQVRGLTLREIGGGFPKHHRAPSIHFACYTVAKPLTMVQKMQNIKKLRGHRDAVYCAIFDHSGRYVITGSDDRLVKIWSMETAFCLASCRGHEGDITDLAISSNNVLVASASNDYSIRVWRIPDGMPTSVLRGHTGAVTAIAFSPRHNSVYQLLSSSDDGTCRIWDARCSRPSLRVYRPKPADGVSSLGKSHGSSSINAPSSSAGLPSHQILCCTYNANGTVFVTGSSDTFARVWSAAKFTANDSEQPHHEMDVLAGHENDVNYVQFCGCSVAPRSSTSDSTEDNKQKFRNSGFNNDNIVTCSRDGSAIIWVPKSRKSHGKAGRWTRAYHLKVPPPPIPPQPPRGGPRQRLLPTPRGVNMIVWSLDNRFVLAAIMDCRICVWNASDGSLVHSLTGHSESTYVLDVHPFNPRIAMSAGYDGKTIVWDIWEGTPIRTYEIGRFKLVDGKFSPDGTSIVLSDDAGQIYLLNTGQGDSQKDAKYDQFFLGDYRPLFQDSAGNVVDQGHQGYLASGGLSEKRPWASIKKNIRAVEFCSVEGLSYSQVPGSGDSCCRITLKFTDPSSTVFGEAFKFTLPELTNYPDFVVERTRYDAAIRRNWSVRDKCQVWWRDESVQGGSWWNGRIVSSKDKSDDFPSSPWERFEIQYDGDSPTTIYYQSPWELYDPESLWEHPHLDCETTDELLSAFAHLQQSVRKNQDPYGILRLNQVAEQPDFINKFPAPLSPDLIESRLKNDYYRSLEAVKHDMRVMLSNAQTYFEKNAEVGAKMKRLSEWFTKMLSNR